ncbi:molecular chaperone TorD family protein [Candidatus Albibeggiatoa sp. nov. NOAA]|uniref:TorD/DmsD family molecular chaperone n=1 Tax=Candidatus Albibeggiatoa sp. nov. NOAA TaxID=3162724 RepID=UPI0032FBE438|nr:molecular chaperone TorD family protein [Thiotrichaceae bacterium]
MTVEQDVVQAFRKAVSDDLKTFAVLLDKELDAKTLQSLKNIGFPDNLGLKLQAEKSGYACELMQKAMSVFPEELDEVFLNSLRADFAAIFLNSSVGVSPYESVWISEESITHQEPMFEMRNWYQKYELAAENWRVRADDHLVLQLEFIAHLIQLADNADSLPDAALFMDEHILRWIHDFAGVVVERCDTPFYAGLVMLTAQYIDELRDVIAGILEQPRPTPEEVEQRLKPRQPAPEEVPLQFMPGQGPSW